MTIFESMSILMQFATVLISFIGLILSLFFFSMKKK